MAIAADRKEFRMTRTVLRLIVLTFLPLAATCAMGEVYKWKDAEGKVHFSDRPPPDLAPKAATANEAVPRTAAAIEAAPGRDQALAGVWSLANMTFGGEVRGDEDLTGSTWTFRGNEFILESRAGKTQRYTIAFDASANPKAFHVTPLPPTSERPGWMIYSAERGQLRIAFRDHLEGRPTGWQGDRKLTVVTLVPKSGAVRNPAGTGLPDLDPCEVLRAQGAAALLGDRLEETRSGSRDAGPGCKLTSITGVITLVYVPAARPEALQAERAKYEKDSRNTMRDEPELGNSAFSSTRGNSTLFAVLRHDTLVMLRFEMLETDAARRRDFTRRVLARF
jgi:uncharacterized protein (TIGR03067 family)